jgi:hypothetical protein
MERQSVRRIWDAPEGWWHMTTLTVPNTPAFERMIAWLHDVARHRSFGLIRTPDGDDFVVMRPEQVAELDAILSDHAFMSAVESGVSDALHGRVRRVERGAGLNDVAGALPVCGSAMAAAVETGVKDALAGRVSKLEHGQSLGGLL